MNEPNETELNAFDPAVVRDRISEQLDKALDANRYIVAVWRIEAGKDSGQARIVLEPPTVYQWTDADFPAALNLLREQFSRILKPKRKAIGAGEEDKVNDA